jgi:hypothetical protein
MELDKISHTSVIDNKQLEENLKREKDRVKELRETIK